MADPEARTTPCRGCGAPMRWAQNISTGRNIPIDPEPVEDGNLVMVKPRVGGALQVRPLKAGDPGPDPSVPRYVAHFATCAMADQFRRP